MALEPSLISSREWQSWEYCVVGGKDTILRDWDYRQEKIGKVVTLTYDELYRQKNIFQIQAWSK